MTVSRTLPSESAIIGLACALALPNAAASQWISDLQLTDSIPAEFLVPVHTAVGKPDGGIFVAQGLDHSVKEFDEHGRLLRVLGTKGKGPGEFGTVNSIGLRGDTLFVNDSGLQRLTFFGPDGAVTRGLRVPPQRGRFFTSLPRAFFTDGSAVVYPKYDVKEVAEGRITHVPVLRVDPDAEQIGGFLGGPIDTIVLIDKRSGVWRIPHADGNSFGPQPFADYDLWGMSGDLEAIYVADRHSSDGFYITRIAADGDTLWRKFQEAPGTPVSRAQLRRTVTKRWEDLRSWGTPVRRAAVGETLYAPKTKPLVQRFFSGLDGSLWVRIEREDNFCWWIFDKYGEARGSVTLDNDGPRIWGMVATATHAWFLRRDDLDVESFFRYRLLEREERGIRC
jgi:hypothetical protein